MSRSPWAALVAALLGLVWATAASAAEGFGIDDYFSLRRVEELALSPDGRRIAYATEAQALAGDAPRRDVRILSTETGDERRPAALASARQLAWTPDGRELIYLDPASGQVFAYGVATDAVSQRTRGADRIAAFRLSPDGRGLAYLARAASEAAPSLYDRFRTAQGGILVDFQTVSLHDFLNPTWNAQVRPGALSLWVQGPDGRSTRLSAPGVKTFAGAFHWSPDGRRLSATVLAAEAGEGILQDDVTGLAIFDLASGAMTMVARGQAAAAGRPALSYAGGEWTPGGRILVRRVVATDPWISSAFPDWAMAAPTAEAVRRAAWRPVELDPRGLGILPVDEGHALVETVRGGVRGLFALGPDGLIPAPRGGPSDGSASLFSFSRDRRSAAFVSESLNRPPEIYLRVGQAPVRRLTRLNAGVAERVGFGWREVTWTASDGVAVRGWLLTPPGLKPGERAPLIVHVHGGPAFPYPNAFAAYFAYWPHPLEVLAEQGAAVFLPNYRGTHSYGRTIAEADPEDAVDDVVTGVRALVDAGLADPARLGISGHSHGAQVGAMAMARSKMFAAASFAEGVASSVVMYELVGAEANREIHDRIYGASLYEDPQRYLADSPDLSFVGVRTPSLFEGGARATALVMLGFPKAAHRAGMPTEFVVYPNSGHNLEDPRLQREAARRNLHWFDFWLSGREPKAEEDAARHARWLELARPGRGS